MSKIKIIFLDADRTITGKHGSILHDNDGNLSLNGPKLLFELKKRGVNPVLLSSRNKNQLFELSRLLGQIDFIGEMGRIVGFFGGKKIKVVSLVPEKENPFKLYKKGAFSDLFENFKGLLELHEPWWKNSRYTLMLRGCLTYKKNKFLLEKVNYYLKEKQLDFLRLLDNGKTERSNGLICQQKRIFHIVHQRLSKLSGAIKYLNLKKIKREEAILAAAGDAPADLELLDIVDAFFYAGTKEELDISLKVLEKQNSRLKSEKIFHKIIVCQNQEELIYNVLTFFNKGV